MSYNKQTWETGQVITAEKLNHMEKGIEDGNAIPICRVFINYDVYTEQYSTDSILADTLAAVANGALLILIYQEYNGATPTGNWGLYSSGSITPTSMTIYSDGAPLEWDATGVHVQDIS